MPQFTVETHSTKNQPQRTVKQVFDVTKKLIIDQKGIQGKKMIDCHQRARQRTTLLTDRAVQLSAAKTSDSVMCMGKMTQNPTSAWEEKIE